jgi:histidine triad (HIT) family protein
MITMHDVNCVFCKIIRGEIPSSKLYEDKNYLAFLDIAPFVKGHTVVVPKEHYINLMDFPEDKMRDYFIAIKNVAILLKTKLDADGINIMQNNFKAAGQVVNHLHFHILPRWNEDKAFPFRIKKLDLSKEDLSEILKKIQAP